MKNDCFYDICDIPLKTRESFNNTILLLTLVKSEFYYIVGFDRMKHVIEIAFDLESDIHFKITESVKIKFDYSDSEICFDCSVANALADRFSAEILERNDKRGIRIEKDRLVFEKTIRKDPVLPVSCKKMNEIILKIKDDISSFLEEYFEAMLIFSE